MFNKKNSILLLILALVNIPLGAQVNELALVQDNKLPQDNNNPVVTRPFNDTDIKGLPLDDHGAFYMHADVSLGANINYSFFLGFDAYEESVRGFQKYFKTLIGGGGLTQDQILEMGELETAMQSYSNIVLNSIRYNFPIQTGISFYFRDLEKPFQDMYNIFRPELAFGLDFRPGFGLARNTTGERLQMALEIPIGAYVRVFQFLNLYGGGLFNVALGDSSYSEILQWGYYAGMSLEIYYVNIDLSYYALPKDKTAKSGFLRLGLGGIYNFSFFK